VGAKTRMLVYADGDARVALAKRPALIRDQTTAPVARMLPGATLKPLADTALIDTHPEANHVHAGCFPGVWVIAADDFGLDRPSELDRRFIDAGRGGTLTLHVMHSMVDWFAFAQWTHGTLVRSLSLSPESGVMEDLGERRPFERPFWAGERPAVDPAIEEEAYPLPFSPLELGEAALDALFGYQLEGEARSPLPDPESVALMRFERSRSRSWWQVWR
jgi:hypothetical protein